MAPLGLRMAIGLLAVVLLVKGELVVKKWPVLPVSAMAVQVVVESTGILGGPKGGLCCNSFAKTLLLQCVPLGFPLCQLRAAGRLRLVFPRRIRKVLFPPCILEAVASVLCPSRGVAQRALVCSLLVDRPCDQQ
jgi:hypothetical protein